MHCTLTEAVLSRRIAGVTVFKIGISLELARRENDAKVVTLNVAMCEMMSILKLYVQLPHSPSFHPPHVYPCSPGPSLSDVANPKVQDHSGDSIESRLKKRMGENDTGMVGSMVRCAKLCDSYHKRHLAGKLDRLNN